MNRGTILVTGADLPAPALEILQDYDIVYAGRAPTESDLVGLVLAHDPVGMIVRYGKITAKVIKSGKRLKALSKYGSGIDSIDTVAAEQCAVEVRAAAGVNAVSVAEHAVGLMLACSKSLLGLDQRMRAGYWDKPIHRSRELQGRTLGLIGLGAIGRHVASVSGALGMRVLSHDPYLKEMPPGIEKAAIDDIWTNSDVISLHCPLNDETRGLVDRRSFEAMKPGVILINTARGGIVDEDALLEAIRNGKVSRAGIDCFAQEPPPSDHPFFLEDRIVLTPHVGAVSEEAYVRVGIAASRNLLDCLR